jgi:heme/copper-type cytochrome/quinol oxidase subunit 4
VWRSNRTKPALQNLQAYSEIIGYDRQANEGHDHLRKEKIQAKTSGVEELMQEISERLVALVILIWGIAAFLLGYNHSFDNTSSVFFGLCIVAIQTTLLLLYFLNKSVKNFFNGINLSTIAILHSWRIFAGWIFISYADQLPKVFVNNAAYGDIIAGFLGIAVFIFGRTKLAYYVFNVVGLIDFILAVGTGITLSLMQLPGTELLTKLPLIIIPFFGVPISGLTHVVSLVRLSKMQNVKLLERVNN